MSGVVLGSSGGTPGSLTAEQLAEAAGIPLPKAIRVLPVAAALVQRYAPDAPIEKPDRGDHPLRCSVEPAADAP